MQGSKLAVVLVSLFAAAGAPARAQVSVCPHVRADNVPAHTVQLGPMSQCEHYLSLFGLSMVVGSTPCPRTILLHPAHQECCGTANYGTLCAGASTIPAYKRECECQPVKLPALGTVDEECVCSAWMQSGTIEDFQTLDCVTVETTPR